MTVTRGLQYARDPEVVYGLEIVGSNKPCCWCGGNRMGPHHPIVVHGGVKFTSCQVPTHNP
jgi:hypothetical protein